MLRSLYSGVTGLKSHQTKLDAIGNNISNVNTTGYRGKTVNFSDVLYQTVAGSVPAGQNTAATNPTQVGLGSMVSSISTTMSKEGSSQVTGNMLDLRINNVPQGFFVVKEGNNVFYTRDGAFGLDQNQELVMRNGGYKVQGFRGSAGSGGLTTLGLKMAPEATVTKSYSKNLSISGNIGKLNDEPDEQGDIKDTTVTINNILSQKDDTYQINFRIDDDGDDDDGTYRFIIDSIKDRSGQELVPASDREFHLMMDEDGKVESVNGGEPTNGTIKIAGEEFRLDFSDVFADTEKENSLLGEADVIPGIPGTKNGYEMGDNGFFYATYTNGEKFLIGQVAIAQFDNPEGLSNFGNNLYENSTSSGTPRYSTARDAGGSISSGILEMSNVELAAEMTDLIIDQRGFQANSKVITTSDEMLQTLRDLKR